MVPAWLRHDVVGCGGGRASGYHFGPLPDGTQVIGLAEGGFQDIILQARLSVDQAGLKSFLPALGLSEDDLRSKANPYLGGDGSAWFDHAAQEGLLSAEGQTTWLDPVAVAVAPDDERPGRWHVYVWSNLT